MRPLPDFGLLSRETVTVRTPSVTFDEHMEEQAEWAEEQVPNVLVRPSSTSDVLESARPDGTRIDFRITFPKSFTASLRGCEVVVRGSRYSVVGDPKQHTPDNAPEPWGMTAEVTAVDG